MTHEESTKLYEISVDLANLGQIMHCMQQNPNGEHVTIEVMNNALYGLCRICEELSDRIDKVIMDSKKEGFSE